MVKVAVLLAEGFEEIEALTVVDVLRRADIKTDMVSVMDQVEVKGGHDIAVVADKLFDENMLDYDMIVLPGGMGGATRLRDDERVITLVQQFAQEDSKYIAAICAAPMVLAKAGVVSGKRVTSYPSEDIIALFSDANYLDELVVVDDNVITSRGPATSLLFAYTLVDVLGGDSSSLQNEMLWQMLEAEMKEA